MLSRTIAVLVTHAEINICCSRLNTVAVRRVVIGASSAFADPSIVAIQPLLHSPQAILLVALIFVVLCERSSGLSFGYFRVEICRYLSLFGPKREFSQFGQICSLVTGVFPQNMQTFINNFPTVRTL